MNFFSRYQKAFIPIGVLISAILIFALLKAFKPEAPLKEIEERFWPVAHQNITFIDVRPFITAYGEITSGREAELRPQISGTILSVHSNFSEGALITKGDLLLRIDDFDYLADLNERRADLNESKAKIAELKAVLSGEEKLLPGDRKQANLATREVARQKKLLKSSAGRRKTYDDSQIALNDRKQNILMREQSIARLKNQVSQAQSNLERTHISLDKAQRHMDNTRLNAPFDGFLSDVNVATGKQVATNDTLARLISLDHLEIAFHISEKSYNHLTSTRDLLHKTIKVKRGDPHQTSAFDAQITRIDARVDSATGGRKIFARLSGLTLKTPLRPGLFVTISIPDQLYKQVVSIPEHSLHDKSYVYVIKQGRLKKRKVTYIAKNNTNVLISAGLNAGEEVCLTRFPEMGTGIKVVMK